MKLNDTSTLKMLHDITSSQSITISHLAREYGLSRPQVRYRLERINEYLKRYGLQPLEVSSDSVSSPSSWDAISEALLADRNGGFVNDGLNTDTRKAAEAIYIFTADSPVSIYDLQSVIRISRNTVISDLKKIQSSAREYQLQLNYTRQDGYRFEGDAVSLRNYLLSCVDNMGSQDLFVSLLKVMFRREIPLLPQQVSEYLKAIYEKRNRNYRSQFLNRGACLVSLLAMAPAADENGELNISTQSEASKIVSELEEILKKDHGIELSETDRGYLCLLAAYIAMDPKLADWEVPDCREAAGELLLKYSLINNLYESFSPESTAAMMEFILFCHDCRFPVVYPHLITRKSQDQAQLNITRLLLEGMSLFENLPLGDDEVAFIADECAGAVSRQNYRSSQETGTALVGECLERIGEYCDIREGYLANLITNLSLQERNLLMELFSLPDLRKVMKPQYIQVRESCDDWKQAIRLAAEPLLSEGIINEAYEEEMIELTSQRSRYYEMFPGIIMPHGHPDNVSRVGFSLLKLNQPVSLPERADRTVSVIIVIATLDNRLHTRALGQLSAVICDEQRRNELTAAADSRQLQKLLYGKEKDE